MTLTSKKPKQELPHVTDEELGLLRHALGLDKRGGRNLTYRNNYSIYPGSGTYVSWCDLVGRELAALVRVDSPRQEGGGMRVFAVTDLGRLVVERRRRRKRLGERHR